MSNWIELSISQPGSEDRYKKTWIRADHISWVCECDCGDVAALVCIEYPHSMTKNVWNSNESAERIMLMLRD